MGSNLSKSLNKRKTMPFIGRQVLNIITSGMYDNPLMIFREFIQNSTDSIDEKYKEKALQSGIVSINIDGKNRSITILDNGNGISQDLVEGRLIDIGHSYKEINTSRGFRGIGRLGALAYANLIKFETRASKQEAISIIEWNGEKLRQISNDKNKFNLTLEECIKAVTKVSTRKGLKSDQPNFFKVSILGVNPFHKDELMNILKIRNYLKQVAPVPINKKFKFAKKIQTHLENIKDYKSYNIFVNDEQIFRPFSSKYQIKKNVFENIKDVDVFDFKNRNGEKIALGWYAKTNYLAAVSKTTLMRGVRIRKGNIEVGDEYYLQDYFTETRFASWHIGELHILSPNIKENARRDGFEQSSDFELLLEKCNILCRHLSNLCRAFSKERSTVQSISQRIEMVKNLLGKKQIYINLEHRHEVKNYIINIMESLKRDINDDFALQQRVLLLEKKLKIFSTEKFVDLKSQLDSRALKHKENKALITEICSSVRSIYSKNMSLEKLIQGMIEPYLK